MKANTKIFLAKVKLTYRGEKRSATVYGDKTAVLDTGEVIQLSDENYDAILTRVKRAEARARSEMRAAALKKAERVREQEQEAKRAAARKIQEQQETEDEDEPDVSEPEHRFTEINPSFSKNRILKIAAATLVYAVVVSGTLAGAKYLIDNHLTRISVAQFSTSIAKDQLITPDNLNRLKMPESIYKELTANAPGEVVLWENAQGIVGQYASMDAIRGQYVTTDYVTPSMTENLWKAAMGSDEKSFNLDFNHFNIDEIFPGSHISVKAIVSFPREDGKGVRVENMTVSGAASLNVGKEQNAVSEGDDNGNAQSPAAPVEEETKEVTPSPQQPAPPENTAIDDVEDGTADEVEPETVSPNSFDTFADVVVLDLKNNYNESLFDIYLRLASMTSEDRRAYLQERAKSTNSKEYLASLTPTVMVLALDDMQYSDLTIVKNMTNATLEFASIPSTNYDSTDEQNSLLMKFKEVQRDVNEIFSAARSGTLK